MIRDALAEAVRQALVEVGIGVAQVPATVRIDRPARPEHGDWSTNVALAVAKGAGRPPREIASELAATLLQQAPAHLAGVEVAGPGFVNFRLLDSWLHEVLVEVVEAGTDGYARADVGGGQSVNVEFVSANPTGPLHVGGGRWAAYGDSVCRLLERCGYAVHREYYLNDRGTQMGLFGRSLAARKAGEEPPADGYQGQYIIDWASEMPGDADPVEWGIQRATDDVRRVLSAINVAYDTWFSERSLVASGALDQALADLRERGVVFEAGGAVWLRSTDFGDHQDQVLVKSDGEPTYLLGDIAYHRDKFGRGFQHLIDVWGSDHHGHVSRLKAGVAALGYEPENLEILLGQLVSIERGGQAVRIGKRSGELVELADVLDEVGPDVARLTFLLQSIDTRQTFDVDLVRQQSKDNPVFYVQYAHARIASIGREAASRGVERRPLAEVDLALLTHPKELDVLRSLADLPDVVLDACLSRAPHKVSTWVRDLAARFHGFYHDCRVLGDEVGPDLTQARLWLVEAAQVGLAIGLDLLGVAAPDSM